ncbi:MAG: FtsW/RodA/SpoVE family cell cycle protein [Lentisphaeraceae bacterium]|nr:FtsW/RodA/SpoVE family cell cycle protein [Lentisphaeraceae bacterium]
MIQLVRFLKYALRSFCPILLSAILLSLWGCLAIYNASVNFPNPEDYSTKQITWLIGGVLVALIISKIHIKRFFELIPWLYGFGIFTLIAVIFWGQPVNHMRGWFHTDYFSIQPSEFCKPFFCLFICWYYRYLVDEETVEFKRYLKLGLASLPVLVLLAMQPDFGTLFIFTLCFAAVYWTHGGKTKYLGWTAAGLLPVLIYVLYRYPYVYRRLIGFWSPEEHAHGAGFHLLQLERTIASGGFWGRSFGKGLWSQGYLPLTHNDSIFASFCEALGFVGGFLLIVIFAGALLLAFRKCQKMSNDLYGYSLFALVFCLSIQAFIHISVNVQILPPTGITLPFISYGGSSLLSSFIIVGLCKSIIASEKKDLELLDGDESSEVKPLEEDVDLGESSSSEH